MHQAGYWKPVSYIPKGGAIAKCVVLPCPLTLTYFFEHAPFLLELVLADAFVSTHKELAAK